LDIFAIIVVLILISSVGFYYYYQKIKTQQRIQQLQLELQKIDQELERAKKFNEEEYAEKVSKILDFESYFSTSTDIEVEGVEIIKKGDRKLVINYKEGYQIEIPGNLILNRSKDSLILNFDNLDAIQYELPLRYWTDLSIFSLEKSEKEIEDIKKQVDGFSYVGGIAQENRYFNIHTKSEVFRINNKDFYKVIYWAKEICDPKIVGEFVSKYCDPNAPEFINEIGYFLIEEDRIYEIYIKNPKLEEYVETFKLIEK